MILDKENASKINETLTISWGTLPCPNHWLVSDGISEFWYLQAVERQSMQKIPMNRVEFLELRSWLVLETQQLVKFWYPKVPECEISRMIPVHYIEKRQSKIICFFPWDIWLVFNYDVLNRSPCQEDPFPYWSSIWSTNFDEKVERLGIELQRLF